MPAKPSIRPASDLSLRKRAEAALRISPPDIANMSPKEIQRLVHEFQVHQIELKLQNEELLASQRDLAQTRDRFTDLYDFAPVGYLTFDEEAVITEANLTAAAMLRIDRAKLINRKFSRFIAREAQDLFYLHRNAVLKSEDKKVCELLLRQKDGMTFHARLETIRYRDHVTQAFFCRSVITDITDEKQAVEELAKVNASLEQRVSERTVSLRESEERFRGLFETLQDAFSVTDVIYDSAGKPVDCRLLDVNPAFSTITGWKREDIVGRSYSELFPSLEKFWVKTRLRTALTGKPAHLEHFTALTGRWYQADYYSPRKGHCACIFKDITERKLTEERMAKLYRLKSIFADIDRAIVHTSDQQKLLNEVCRITAGKGGFKLAWVGLIAPNGSVQPVAKAGKTGYLKGIRVVVSGDEPEGCGPIGTCIRENRAVVCEDIEQGTMMAPWRDRARKFGLKYAAAFPLRIDNEVVGAFQFYAPQANFFDEDELNLLTQVSNDISFALTAMTALAARKQAEEALQAREAQLHSFVQHTPAAIAMLDRNMNYLAVSERWMSDYGRNHSTVVGRNHYELNPDLPKQWAEVDRRGLAGETLSKEEDLWLQADGTRMWLRWAVSPWLDASGNIGGIMIMGENITAKKNAEEELSKHKQRLTGIIESALDAIISVDADMQVIVFNQAAEKMFLCPVNEALGQPLHRFIAMRFLGEPNDHIFHFGEAGPASRLMGKLGSVTGLRKQNEEFPIEASISHINTNGEMIYTFILRDMTDRQRLEEALLRASEEERQRIGRDLHDGLGQELTAIALLNNMLQNSLRAKELPEAIKAGGRLAELLHHASAQVRRISHGLQPVSADPDSLMLGLKMLMLDADFVNEAKCVFQCEQSVSMHNPDSANHLYRIAQEAVQNALRHGKPKNVIARLKRKEDWVSLEIQDDGDGFDPNENESQGIGLRTMRYRADAMNGFLEILPQPQSGILVHCSITDIQAPS